MEQVIAALCTHLASEFRHSVLCMAAPEANRVPLPDDVDVEVVPKPTGHSLTYFWRLRRALSDLRPDLLCTYNWNGMDGIVAGRLAGIRRIVQCEHGWASPDPRGASWRRRRVRRFLSRWTVAQICVSDGLRDWLSDVVGVKSPVIRIANGVDTERFRPGANGGGSEPRRPTIGVVARHDPKVL